MEAPLALYTQQYSRSLPLRFILQGNLMHDFFFNSPGKSHVLRFSTFETNKKNTRLTAPKVSIFITIKSAPQGIKVQNETERYFFRLKLLRLPVHWKKRKK